jgi:hypothetical protein
LHPAPPVAVAVCRTALSANGHAPCMAPCTFHCTEWIGVRVARLRGKWGRGLNATRARPRCRPPPTVAHHPPRPPPRSLAIQELLCKFFQSVISAHPDDLLMCVYLCCNKLAPAYVGLELGIGDTLLIKALAEASGACRRAAAHQPTPRARVYTRRVQLARVRACRTPPRRTPSLDLCFSPPPAPSRPLPAPV